MSEKHSDFRREVRDTIVKSGLTGVAATVLAVTLSSPAGLGGMVGTSLASGDVSPSDAYANLPPYPAPLTAAEVTEIRGQLAATAASLALTREATDDVIAHMRDIAARGQTATLAPQAANATMGPSLRVAFSDVEEPAEATPVSYAPAAVQEAVDPNLELATLLFSYDNL
jgi:hypothetical protein